MPTPRTEDRARVLSLEAFLRTPRFRLAMGNEVSRATGSTKGAKARADKLFSQIVRSVGRCQSCGKTDNLQCAHVISRRFSNTRCEIANAFCLCAKCHHFFTDHPVDWGWFVIEQMGLDRYAQLLTQSQVTSKVVWVDVVQRLKLRAKELELV